MTAETATPNATEELPTHCEGCGQKLLIQAPGRTRCERCRMGRGPVEPEVKLRSMKREDDGPAVPCRACGQTEVPDHPGLRLPLADGYCLGCRVLGRHVE